MVTKKPRHRRVRRISRIVPAGLLLILSGSALVLFLALGPSEERPARPPAYEERRSVEVPGIERINRAVFGALYRGGVREDDICFVSVQPFGPEGDGWQFTELVVSCRDRKRAAALAEAVRKVLADLDPDIDVRMKGRTRRGLVYGVALRGRRTHEMVFSVDACRRHAGGRPQIAIVVDDLGYDPEMASAFMGLNLDLTLSILPSAPYTRSVAAAAAEKGFEALLHLPMEPRGYPEVRPGAGALLLKMTEGELKAVLASDLEQVPEARGVNNHMGSVFTEDREKMSLVLRELRHKGLFYIDSRTSSRTVGFGLAREMGVPAGQRDVFLDNDLDPKAIRIQMERLKGLARHSGGAVGICHPFRGTWRALRDMAHDLGSEVEVVPVSRLVK